MTKILTVTQAMHLSMSEVFSFYIVTMRRVYAIDEHHREVLGPTMRQIQIFDNPHKFTQLVREKDTHWYDWGHDINSTWLELYDSHFVLPDDRPDIIHGAYAKFGVVATGSSCCTEPDLLVSHFTDAYIAGLPELKARKFGLNKGDWQAEVEAAKERIEKAPMAKEDSHVR
jgi:hypothetical protein